MTPEQKIKHLILIRAASYDDKPAPQGITAESIDEEYDCEESDSVQEAKYEIRKGEVETDLPCQYSRHYESKSVATKAPDGSWVGWTFWYGGGKHGEPEAVDWMDEAYDLSCIEEEKMVVVRTFAKSVTTA